MSESSSTQNVPKRRPRHRQPPRIQQSWIPKGSTTETTTSQPRSGANLPQIEETKAKMLKNTRKPRNANVPLLVQEIQEKLAKGIVECMICCDMVRRSAPIWSCASCYSIFHLSCIKKWARAPTSTDIAAERNQGSNWRCPGCQSVQTTNSKDIRYMCFCNKRMDPISDMYLTPHSCGEVCGKPLEKEAQESNKCPHLCVLQCHPGPCPPCKAYAPPRKCPCGSKVVTTRCADRSIAITCGNPCGKLLLCLRHNCESLCHEGACEACKVTLSCVCFCKKKATVVSCGELELKGEFVAEDGIFSCGSSCGRILRCGNHFCTEVCHPGPCGDCSSSPENMKTCACGKTPSLQVRTSCLDPIPTCGQKCRKLLPCGLHRCDKDCHVGDCQQCEAIVSQSCRCGSTSRTTECYKTSLKTDPFICEALCGKKKNCGRHRCSERCCPKEPSSDERDPHICHVSCGKKLRCKQHSCEALCHSGYCPPCMYTIFTDLTCSCGATSLPPPLPCGTPPPSCQFLCSVPQPCGHPASHCCHFGACPPCSVAVSKECVGGHLTLKNIPCGSKDIRCNNPCGKTRRCGLHACEKPCHPPPCDGPSDSSSCGQVCGAPRRQCKHTCQSPCHPSSACPDLRCEFPVTVSCPCGRITAKVPCDAGGADTSGNSNSKLVCDEECAKQERKKVLADAFDVGTSRSDSLFAGENPHTAEVLSDAYRREPKWVVAVEERCRELVLGKKKGSTGGVRVHVFSPMVKDKRDAVRLIADRWKLAIGCAGYEPKRFVVVHALPKSRAPLQIISSKGAPQPPVFNPTVDMDPRLVVSFVDLPRDAEVSSLVLRFGGECEMVWLNDKNALAVFSEAARAATAMRRLNYSSAYNGACVVVAGGNAVPSHGGNVWVKEEAERVSNWKKAVADEGADVADEVADGGVRNSFSNLDFDDVADDWEQRL